MRTKVMEMTCFAPLFKNNAVAAIQILTYVSVYVGHTLVLQGVNDIVTMEEIEYLKAKYAKVDTSVLKDLILSQTGIIDKIKKNQDQQYNGKLC